MQKKIIALAIAGLASTAAFAQSNVTIYGVVDTFYGHSKVDGLKGMNRIENGGMAGSRIGFKGTEDLGNGLKALFTLEYNIATDVNSGIGDAQTIAANGGNAFTGTQSRQSFVGLSSDYGTVVAGRLQTAGYYFAAAYTPFGGTGFDNANLIGGNLQAGTTARLSNAVAYVSPTFAGFTAEWDHARQTETAATNTAGKDSTANELSLKYANGPLTAQAIYLKIDNDATPETALAGRDDSKQWGLGASYNFGFATVMGMYKTVKAESNNALTDNKTNKMWSLGVSAPVGAKGTVLASYAKSSVDTASDADSKGWGIGYRYAFSKRTTAYVNYTAISNDTNGAVYVGGYTTAGGGSVIAVPGTGADSNTYGVGINHSF